MDVMRRCKECRRAVAGHAGDACPYCGSTALITVTAPVPVVKHHPSVVTAAITFFGGLFAMRLIALLFATKYAFAAAMAGELLQNLQLLIGVATVMYVILRRREGDFTSLFILSFILFGISEGLAALSRAYGLMAFSDLSVLFSLALIVYAALALIAGLADGPGQNTYHRALLIACLGFLGMSVLRVFFQLRGGDLSEQRNRITSAVMAVLIVALGVMLFRSEWKTKPRETAAEPKPAGTPGPVLTLTQTDRPAELPTRE